ncbi:uncharacterized protein FA14DRAFT_172673 [Meira miltonrushii]|uniref:RFX-type winged-helix domain-containing protein n=1 Tax=Meira miltonrushii TaxID=1280837 RepID=A0A316VKP6_9BASI|nr:uncharacterized protein FA14DRAFT_172673 [Meira miltonrushii]PWN36095.1 hypothetical protein FA14DRAFT_172673 [Meira miltonrushii]
MQNIDDSPTRDASSPPIKRGPGRPRLNRNAGSPPAASTSPSTPRQWAQLPNVSNQNGAAAGGNSSGAAEPYVPPHLHPAYRGRGRPPLALGRRMGQGPPVNTAKKPSNSSPTPTYTSSPQLHRAPPQHHSHIQHPNQSNSLPPHAGPSPVPRQMLAHAQNGMSQRPRHPLDGKEPTYLAPGPNNRLLLSLKSGIPSHISWALSRLTFTSMHNVDSLILDQFPGLLEALMQFPKRLVYATNGDNAQLWDPQYWEQPEREYDGLGVVYGSSSAESDEDDGSDSDGEGMSNKGGQLVKFNPVKFQPHILASHQRILDYAVSALLVLRNASLFDRNEKVFLQHSRPLNAIICNILAAPQNVPSYAGPQEWNEQLGMHETRVYALDILEVTRTRIHVRRRAAVQFDQHGVPIKQPSFSDLVEAASAEAESLSKEDGADTAANIKRSTAVHVSDHLFSLLVWQLHTTDDRSVLIGCLRCLGALAADERNEKVFLEVDIPTVNTGEPGPIKRVSSPGILRKCLSLLPLTHDLALLDSALDCLFQIINLSDNSLRLGAATLETTADGKGPSPLFLGTGYKDAYADEEYGRSIGDVRSIVRYLARDLIYGRVVWDRVHQLVLHPALHGHIPSAVNSRRREKDEILRLRKKGREGEPKDRQRRLNKEEWLKQKDLREPERLRTWMRTIYEAKEDGEVTQMEFWTTYSSQFGPYSQLGGPPLLPAAEVIRAVSNIFPGALAMVLPDKRFIVRGVQPRELQLASKFECRWKGCNQSETDTYAAVETHVRKHIVESDAKRCQWAFCTYEVPEKIKDPSKHLHKHALTHVPDTDEEQQERDTALQRAQYLHEVRQKSSMKSDPISITTMPNGARSITGLSAMSPNDFVQSEWRKIEQERLDAIRRKKLNLPTRGTVDLPDYLTFHVTRTPMDPNTQKPIGVASTAALILRTLARNAANVLMKAGLRQERTRADGDVSDEEDVEDLTKLSDRFGLPLPPTTKEAERHNEDVTMNGVADSSTGQWTIAAAKRIMDSLVDVEDDLMQIASENDILCPTLNEVLTDLLAEPGESVIDRKRKTIADNFDSVVDVDMRW